MATVLREDTKEQRVSIKIVDVLLEAQSLVKRTTVVPFDSQSVSIEVYHPSFSSVIGERCSFALYFSTDSSRNPFFYKGCAYIRDTDELYITSSLLQSTSSSRLPVVLISRLDISRFISSDSNPDPATASIVSPPPIIGIQWTKLRPPPNMPMPAGVISYKKGVLYCSQGTLEPNSGGLYYMPPGKRPVPLVTNYFGRAFNSVQNVVEDTDGGLWFTDSCIGFEQEIRPRPQLPNHVYWFQPKTGELRVVADGLGQPTGIALSPGGETLYVTDTGDVRMGNMTVSTSSATIYAYEVVRRPGASPSLIRKCVFAFAFSGVPSAVICDPSGNVYAACGDGVEVWNSEGTALGVIQIPGGCSALCFGRSGELFVCGGQTFWKVQLQGVVFQGTS